MVDRFHRFFGQTASEAGKGAMIWGGLIHGKSQKFLEREPIIDLGFQLGVGIDAEPLLQKQAFQKQERVIGIGAFRIFPDGIASEYQLLNLGPVDDGVDFLHSFDGPVTIQGVEEGDVGKGKKGSVFLKLMIPPGGEFKGITAKERAKVKY